MLPSTPSAPALSHARTFLWRESLIAGRSALLRACLAQVTAGGVGLLLALLLALVLTDLAQGPMPTIALLIGTGALAVLRAGLYHRASVMGARTGVALQTRLRSRLMRQLLALGPVGTSEQTSGALSLLLIDKVQACEAYAARALPLRCAALIVPVGALMVLLALSPTAALVLLGTALLMPILLGLFGWLTATASRRQLTAMTRMGSLFADRLRHLTLLLQLGATAHTHAELTTRADELRARTMSVLRLAFLSASVLDAALAASIVALVILLHTQGLLLMLAVLLLTLEFFVPLRAYLAGYHERALAVQAAADIATFLAQPATEIGGDYNPAMPTHGGISVDWQGLELRYSGRDIPVLSACSGKVDAGELVALCGPSGSGKSSLLLALMGLLAPHGGMLRLAGQPLERLHPQARRRLIAFIGQRPTLFAGTLGENIALGQPQADPASLTRAAQAAGLGPLVQARGLECPVGEGGFGLSGGQAQRVALARALLQQAPLLMLDEPTTGLDPLTARDLLQTLCALKGGHTLIIASHDPAVLACADRVIHLPVPSAVQEGAA